jgi:hypothetical protein
MDIETIDQQYQQLQGQAQGTAQELSGLAEKLQRAAQAGNQDAREWLLDLKSIALSFKAEQTQVGLLLQALHGFVANQASSMQAPPPPPTGWAQAPNQPPPGYQGDYGPPQQGDYGPPQQGDYGPPQQGGYGAPQQGGYGAPQQGGYGPPQQGGVAGMLGSFLSSGVGRAIEMGAGFGLGDDLIKKIF